MTILLQDSDVQSGSNVFSLTSKTFTYNVGDILFVSYSGRHDLASVDSCVSSDTNLIFSDVGVGLVQQSLAQQQSFIALVSTAGSGTVTINFTSGTDLDPDNAILNIEQYRSSTGALAIGVNGKGNAWTTNPTLTLTPIEDNSRMVVTICNTGRAFTDLGGFDTERSETIENTGSGEIRSIVVGKSIPVAQSTLLYMTLSGGQAWIAIGVTIHEVANTSLQIEPSYFVNSSTIYQPSVGDIAIEIPLFTNNNTVYIPSLYLSGDIYYVDTINGSDITGDGSSANPWASVNHSISNNLVGKVLRMRDGSYSEEVVLDYAIVLENDIGHSPIFDGLWDLTYPVPAVGVYPEGNIYDGNKTSLYTGLIKMAADNVTVRGLTVKNSGGRGVVGDAYDGLNLSDCTVFNCYNAGIYFEGSTNYISRRCVVYNVGLQREDEQNPTGTNWPVSFNNVSCTNGLIEYAIVHDTHGEGISIGRYSNGCTVRHGIFYDNRALNAYIQNAYNSTYDSCLIYCTDNAQFGYKPGLVIANEWATVGEPGDTHRVVNCIVGGCRDNIAFWTQNKGALVNTVIAHNTIINARTNLADGKTGECFSIGTPADGYAHSNTVIHSNIIIQTITENGESLISISDTTGLTFRNNGWSTTPPASVQGIGDFTISLTDLVNPGSGTFPAGTVDPDDYRLTGTSPAISAGWVDSDVVLDFSGVVRGAPPDAGAYEYLTEPTAVVPDAVSNNNVIYDHHVLSGIVPDIVQNINTTYIPVIGFSIIPINIENINLVYNSLLWLQFQMDILANTSQLYNPVFGLLLYSDVVISENNVYQPALHLEISVAHIDNENVLYTPSVGGDALEPSIVYNGINVFEPSVVLKVENSIFYNSNDIFIPTLNMPDLTLYIRPELVESLNTLYLSTIGIIKFQICLFVLKPDKDVFVLKPDKDVFTLERC